MKLTSKGAHESDRKHVCTVKHSDDLGEAGVFNDGLRSEKALRIRFDSVPERNALSVCRIQRSEGEGAYTWPLHLAAWMPILIAL
jgi:hypothetical protein